VRPSDFLADFFGASTGSIFLTSLPNERDGGRPAEICGRGDGARLDELVLHRWDRTGRGTFFCVSTLRPRQSRRSKETVFEITGLHADVDFAKINMEPGAAQARLGQLLCLPSKIVRSGHGFHAYWLLREAIPATPEVIAQAETLLRHLADIVGGDPAVCEVARLMRLPGSFNTKNGGKIPVEIIVDRPVRYDMDELAEWIGETRPLIPRKGETSAADNPFLGVNAPVGTGGPLCRHRGATGRDAFPRERRQLVPSDANQRQRRDAQSGRQRRRDRREGTDRDACRCRACRREMGLAARRARHSQHVCFMGA